jgi:hypothetical protein
MKHGMRTLTATAIRATPAGRDHVALIISTIETTDDDHTELLELVIDRRVLTRTMRDVLDIILQTWHTDPKDPTDA